MWGKGSCLRKQHDGLDLEPPTFRSEVQRANYYTTMPPHVKFISSWFALKLQSLFVTCAC